MRDELDFGVTVFYFFGMMRTIVCAEEFGCYISNMGVSHQI